MRAATLVAAVVLLVSSLAAYGFAEARTARVVTTVVAGPDVPREFDGARIAFVTDIHTGLWLRGDRLDQLIEQVNSVDADVLLLGGDNVGGRVDGADVFYERAGGFEANLAKLAVLGNHDAWEGEGHARSGLEAAGFDVLDNEVARVSIGDASIDVAGVEDLYTGRPDVVGVADDVSSDFAVLLSHNPDVFARGLEATEGTFDLALAGHTHGGQVSLFGLYAPIVPSRYGQRYAGGMHQESGATVVVSNGIGTGTMPVRLFVPPQIHVFELRRAPEAAVWRPE